MDSHIDTHKYLHEYDQYRTDTETHRHTDTETYRHTDTETDTFAYRHICIQTHTHTDTHAYRHARIHTHAYRHTRVHTHAYRHTRVQTQANTHRYTSIQAHTNKHIHNHSSKRLITNQVPMQTFFADKFFVQRKFNDFQSWIWSLSLSYHRRASDATRCRGPTLSLELAQAYTEAQRPGLEEKLAEINTSTWYYPRLKPVSPFACPYNINRSSIPTQAQLAQKVFFSTW